ncbi:MAG TPA: CopD family protein [Thermoanaerobaculia bacterium]
MLKWSEALAEFVGFIASFFATGAVGFRLAIIDRVVEEKAFHRSITIRAAAIGLIGSAGSAAFYFTGGRMNPTATVLYIAAIVGFVLVLARVSFGWWIAAIGVVFAPLTPALSGQWTRLINPIHRLAAGFWIGTLFVVIVAGVAPLLTSGLTTERRGAFAAAMIHAFSPLALGSAFVLVVFGVITAWRHLKRVDALWTTPYGYALIVKLFFVLGVVALGGWNWRRQRPLLGSERAAVAIRRSATAELFVALMVLVVTAILVSLPSPK